MTATTFLALVCTVACVSRTICNEEIFREFRNVCHRNASIVAGRSLWCRKFFYLFTCEYCFSHWVTLLVLLATQQRIAFGDHRGYVIAFFTIVWSANVLLNLFDLLKQHTRYYRASTEELLNRRSR